MFRIQGNVNPFFNDLGASVALGADKTPARRGLRTRRPERLRTRVRFRPQVGFLEQRALLSGDVVYKNTTNPTGGGIVFNGATQIGSDLAAYVDINKLTLAAGSAGLPITSLNFLAYNFNAETVEARPTMYVWAGNGAGAPGTLLGDFALPITTLDAGVDTRLSFTVPTGSLIVPNSMNLFTGVGFDNDNGATQITADQLNALGGLTYHPATIGTDGPQAYFFLPDIPLNNPAVAAFGASYGANYGWNVTANPLTSLSWDDADMAGGVTLTYTLNSAQSDTIPVDFYWSPTQAFEASNDTLAASTMIQSGQTSSSTIQINASSLAAPPAGSEDLLAVINPATSISLAYDPELTVTSKYNGSADPSTFGRFLSVPGVITDETLTIQLSDSLAALRPTVSTVVNGQTVTTPFGQDGVLLTHDKLSSTGSWDGVTYESDAFDPGSRSQSTTLNTQALLGDGTNLMQVSDTLDVEPLPDWMESLQSQAGLKFTSAPGGPNESETGSYSLSGLVTDLSLPIASTIPSDVPIVGGEQVGASAGLGLNLTIPLGVTSAPTASGYADVSLTLLNTVIFDKQLQANFSTTSQNGSATFTVTPTFTINPETLAADGGFGITFTVDDSAQLASQSVASRDVVLVVGGVPVTTHFGITITPSYDLNIQATVTDTSTAGVSLVPTGTFISLTTTAGLQVQAQSGIFVPPTLVSTISPYLSPVLQTLHRLMPSLFPSSATLPNASLEATLTGTLTVNSQVNYTGGIDAVPLAVSINGVINATSAVDLEFAFTGIGTFLIPILNYNLFPNTFPYGFTILS
jgi:hypothetical protein